MPYLTLKVVHLVALALTFMGLAGALASNAVSPGPSLTRRIFAISHGLGLVLLLISGFFLLIQLGIGKNLPGWVWGKVIIWLLAGASAALVRRFARFKVGESGMTVAFTNPKTDGGDEAAAPVGK